MKHIYVGMDVHKNSNEIALAEGGRNGEVRFYGSVSNDLHAMEKFAAKLKKSHPNTQFHFVYEAGPCGFVLLRRFHQLKLDCVVVAPSKIPKRSGDKVKTDKRDAIQLAKLHRAGELTPIHVPDAKDEALRDLCRARTDARKDLHCARQRLKSFLLRNGYKYSGKTSWTAGHMRYLRELVLGDPCQKMVLEEHLMHIDHISERIQRCTEQIGAQALTWRWYPVVEALMCMKGIQLLSAVVIVAELGDINRFDHPRQLMSFLGLVTSEYSSGNSRSQGAITKAGNSHARAFLVEIAQHYMTPPKVSKELSKRQQGQPESIRQIAWKAQLRLNKRFWYLLQRGLAKNNATVTVARELTGFIWAIYRQAAGKVTS